MESQQKERLSGAKILSQLCLAMTLEGKREAEAEYGKGTENLRGKWEAYHLLEYTNSIRVKVKKENLDGLLDDKGITGISAFRKMLSRDDSGITDKNCRAIFQVLAKLQGDMPVRACVAKFLEFCAERDYPVRMFEGADALKQAAADIRDELDREANANNEALGLPLTQPRYVPPRQKDGNESEDSDEISLDALDHHSIPLIGRDEENKALNSFLSDKKPFRILPVVGPSGAGKTRLVTEWYREVNRDRWQAAGFVDGPELTPWQKWTPSCDTLIIIDYVYRFDQVIHEIIKKGEQTTGHKIRLIVLHHIFPKKLRDFMQDQFGQDAFGAHIRDLKAREDFLYPTLYLEQVGNRREILRRIISHVSGIPVDNSRVAKAVLWLEGKQETENKPAQTDTSEDKQEPVSPKAHPLFAILLAQALKEGKLIEQWKRHDLINYYLNTPMRKPWEHPDTQASGLIGYWVGAFVAAATVRRGLSFGILRDYIPAYYEIPGDRLDRIESWCRDIVSSQETDRLKPFEPDILGENFVLLFFKQIEKMQSVRSAFIDMLCAEDNYDTDDGEKPDITRTYIEFSQRLARNLANEDDQESYDIRDAWQTFSEFLNPELYPNDSPFRLAVSLAIIEVSDVLEEKKLSELNPVFFRHISEDDLVAASANDTDTNAATFAFVKYFDRCSEAQRNQQVFCDRLFDVCRNFGTTGTKQANGLHVASYCGCLNAATLLLKQKGTNVDAVNSENVSALVLASLNGHEAVAALLIREGATVDLSEGKGWTALMLASQEGHEAVAALLIREGATVDLSEGKGWTALMLASQEGHEAVAALLIREGATVDSPEEDGVTALMLASQEGHEAVAALLIREGAAVDLPKEDGKTALMLASQNGHEAVAALLIREGAAVDLPKEDGVTALMLASYSGHEAVAALLIREGATVDLPEQDGTTALMLASINGQEAVAALLIREGATVDLPEQDGTTALMLASLGGQEAVAALLIKAGATIDLVDKQGKTALTFARENGHACIVDLLTEAVRQ